MINNEFPNWLKDAKDLSDKPELNGTGSSSKLRRVPLLIQKNYQEIEKVKKKNF